MVRLYREPYVTLENLDVKLQGWLSELADAQGRKALPPLDSRAVLFLIDMQRLFLDSDSPAFLPAWPAIASRCSLLLQSFRNAGLPVYWTQHFNPQHDDGGVMEAFGGRPLREEDPLASLAEGWGPFDREPLLAKSRYSVCASNHLDSYVPHDAVVVLAGVTTHRCILATAVDMAMRDRLCVVAADACATLNESIHRQSLGALAQGFAYVASTEEIQVALGPQEEVE